MRIHLLAGGSRGDIQPLVALAIGLKNAGYDVRFWAHPVFAELVSSCNLNFCALGRSSPQATIEHEFRRRPRTPLGKLSRIISRPAPAMEDLISLERAVAGADALVFNTIMANCTHIVEKANIPCVAVHYQPYWRTRYLPHPLFPVKRSMGGALNLLTHAFFNQLSWQADRKWINQWRRDHLKLPNLGLIGGHSKNLYKRRIPQIFAFSPTLIQRFSDWPEWFHVPGFFFLDLETNWAPPESLVSFLSTGPPPIAVGFGSIVDPDLPRLFRLLMDLFNERGWRGIFLGGWTDVDLRTSDNIYVLSEAPHDWLFRRVAASVQAGGAGTVAAALRAGAPPVLIPLHSDQRFWADRLYRLGLSPPPVGPENRNRETLSSAIEAVLSDKAIRERVRKVSEVIEREQGVQTAVDVITSYLKQGTP